MKRLCSLLAIIIIFHLHTFAQDNYWQQDVSYKINVTLNDIEKSLQGFETIVYKNNSPANLDFIWFHIWPNAYSSENTALFKQIKNDKSRKKTKEQYSFGSISGLDFKVDDKSIKVEPHPEHVDVIKLILASPLKPGDSVRITTPFVVKLPGYFSRAGYADGEFIVCQWYPKPAVFDKNGWHEFPYLDMGEFYSEFGRFDVSITVPSDYIVAATGTMQTISELSQYKKVGADNLKKNAGYSKYVPGKDKTKTLNWVASDVPDFAWFADKNYIIRYDTAQLQSGRIIDAFTYSYDKKKTPWVNSIDYVEDGLRKYSEWIGEYAYPVVQAVEGPKNNASGGMEYPMITIITAPDSKEESLDAVITHEVGHNWFMSMLGSNERKHTWMDEGLNTYYQFRYEAEKYRSNSIFGNSLPREMKQMPAEVFQEIVYKGVYEIPMESAIETPAHDFKNSDEYGLISYIKAAMWMYILESSIGREKVDAAVKNYFNKWKFKHPQPSDMRAAFEEAIGGSLQSFFDLLNKKGKL
jgi:hypothetical protein